jgi:hypothetical protein
VLVPADPLRGSDSGEAGVAPRRNQSLSGGSGVWIACASACRGDDAS